jgi:VWFA-related protein
MAVRVIVPLLLSLFATVAYPQTFSTEVTLVHVDAQVLNREGNLVPGLGLSDFRIFDEGKEQPIVAFAAEEQPLDLVLLVDVSGSMNHAVEDFAEVGQSALNQLRQGDRVAVMSFTTHGQLVAPFTDILAAVKLTVYRLSKADFRGNTHIYDGIFDAAGLFNQLDDKARRRRVVLIFTDNGNQRGKHGLPSVVESLWEADATLNGLITQRSLPRGAVALPVPPLARGIAPVVARTGGEILRVGDVESSFPEMLRRIRNRYSPVLPTTRGENGCRQVD